MNTYGIALFVHIVGLIALFSALVLLQRGVVRLRTASTWEEARVWLGMMRPVGGMFLFGTLDLLATGLYMARLQWTSDAPWVVVGEIVVVACAVVGAIVSWLTGRGFGRWLFAAGALLAVSGVTRLIEFWITNGTGGVT